MSVSPSILTKLKEKLKFSLMANKARSCWLGEHQHLLGYTLKESLEFSVKNTMFCKAQGFPQGFTDIDRENDVKYLL